MSGDWQRLVRFGLWGGSYSIGEDGLAVRVPVGVWISPLSILNNEFVFCQAYFSCHYERNNSCYVAELLRRVANNLKCSQARDYHSYLRLLRKDILHRASNFRHANYLSLHSVLDAR